MTWKHKAFSFLLHVIEIKGLYHALMHELIENKTKPNIWHKQESVNIGNFAQRQTIKHKILMMEGINSETE